MVLCIKNEITKNYQIQFIPSNIDSCFEIKNETFLTKKQFEIKLHDNKLPQRFITMTYIDEIWDLVVQKNIKICEAYPNYKTRQEKNSM